jgi:hypothetical protein
VTNPTGPTDNPESTAATPVSGGETPSVPDHQPVTPAPEQPAYQGQQPAFQGQQQPYGAPQPYPGAQQQPYPGATGYGVQPPSQKKGIKPWVWWVIGGGAALLVIIIVGVVLLITLLGGGGAKAAATDYLSDLAKGNAKAANTLAHLDAGDKNNALLTNAVLGKAKKITSAQVIRTTASGSSSLTYVYVGYQLGGKTYRDVMQLDKDDKGWYVRKGLTYNLPYLSSTDASSDSGYTLSGGTVAITSDSYDLVAYPGIYAAAAPSAFFDLKGSADITVAPDAPTSLKGVSLTPSQKYIDAVQAQVNAHLDKCAALTDYYDIEDCGIALGFPDNVMISGSKVAVKVTAYPKVEVNDSDSYEQFKLNGGSFSATITGATYDGGTATESIEADGSYTSASIEIKDGKVTVTFD